MSQFAGAGDTPLTGVRSILRLLRLFSTKENFQKEELAGMPQHESCKKRMRLTERTVSPAFHISPGNVPF